MNPKKAFAFVQMFNYNSLCKGGYFYDFRQYVNAKARTAFIQFFTYIDRE